MIQTRWTILLLSAVFCSWALGVAVQQACIGAVQDVPTKAWGEEHLGLQCRVDAPTEIEQGMPVQLDARLRCFPKRLPPGTKSLNTFIHDAFFELSLTNRATNEGFTVKPYDPTHGMPALDRGTSVSPLDATAIAPLPVSFPLATVYDSLAPGSYRCQVRLTCPKKPTPWWRGTADDWQTAGFWHGTVASHSFPLEVTAQLAKTRQFQFPKRLEVVNEKNEQDRAVAIVRYRKQDTERVALPVRKGHFLGWRMHEVDVPGGILQGGTPSPEDTYRLSERPDGDKGRERQLTIEVFETAVRAHHCWMPESNGYRVL